VTGTDAKVRTARTRQLAAARRSLKLVADALPEHVAALADGAVLGDGFLVSALKYEQARQALVLLDSLAAPDGTDEVLVSREYLRLLTGAIVTAGLAPSVTPGDGSPLGQLLELAGSRNRKRNRRPDMQEMQILSSCDMTFAATGERVPSEETVFLALGRDPQALHPVQLDLTGDWAKALREFLAPFLDAGHDPGQVLVPGAQLPGRARPNDPGARAYWSALRAWCDETGFTPAYRELDKGGYYYPRRLKDAYARYLAALAGPGLQEPA
jgi:hypothetical protein